MERLSLGYTTGSIYEIIYGMDLFSPYGKLLGVGEEWKVSDVKLDMAHPRVDIYLDYGEKCAPCPECGTLAPMHDAQEERVWRHLDTMQFTTLIHARPPRCRCERHGVKVIDLPWAEKGFALHKPFRSVRHKGPQVRAQQRRRDENAEARLAPGAARSVRDAGALPHDGVAPPYHDIGVMVGGKSADGTLKGLHPGESRHFSSAFDKMSNLNSWCNGPQLQGIVLGQKT